MENREVFSEIIKSKLEQLESTVPTNAWNAIHSSVKPASFLSKLGVVKVAITASVIAGSLATYVFYYKDYSLKVDDTEIKLRQHQTTISTEEDKVNSIDNSRNNKVYTNKEDSTAAHTFIVEEAIEMHNSDSFELTASELNMEQPTSNQATSIHQPVVVEPKMESLSEQFETDKKIIEKPVTIEREKKVINPVLPNVFTPNKDGINDVLELQLDDLSDFSVVIMNRNNKVVFQSTDVHFSWDGSNVEGTTVEAGDYVYYIVGKDAEGNTITAHSSLRIQY